MEYEIYNYIFIGAAILSGIMLLVSILLFFLLKIPRVIGDLTGRTARKAIEDIRNQNESTGDKTYKSSTVNRQRGKITDKISPSGNLVPKHPEMDTSAMGTAKISTARLPSEETTVLDVQNETTVLDGTAAETTVLSAEQQSMGNETTVLNPVGISDSVFQIEYEITYIHSNEIITVEVG